MLSRPCSAAARAMRTAISPRLAISNFDTDMKNSASERRFLPG
jgi:hypothetical protein